MAEPAGTWRDVRVGALIIATVAIALFVLWIQRGRNPFAEAYSLVLFVDDAKGLQEGAPVTLSGLLVGEVQRIDVLAPSARLRARYSDRLEGVNIRIVLGVEQRYRHEITDRSRARISSQGASGARYVRLEKGPVGGTPLRSGGRVMVAPSLDVEYLLSKGGEVIRRVESLNRNAAEVGAKIKAGGGTLGRFVADPADNEAAENFEDMNQTAARVMRSLDEGKGTFGLERRTGRIRANLQRFQSALGEIQRKAAGGAGSLGKFASDTTLSRSLERLQARVDLFNAKLERGDGSLGRFMNDPELFNQLEALTAQLDSLALEVAQDPLGSVDVDLH